MTSNGPIRGRAPKPAADAPEYRVTKVSFIGGRLVGPGCVTDVVRYEGVPGKALEPLNDAARKAIAERDGVPVEAVKVPEPAVDADVADAPKRRGRPPKAEAEGEATGSQEVI